MTSRSYTHGVRRLPASLKSTLKTIKKALNYRIVLVPRKKDEMRLATFTEDISGVVDCAEGLFSRHGKTVALFKLRQPTLTLRSLQPNPKRVNLYRQPGIGGLHIFYYTTSRERLLFACRDEIIPIQRDDIPAVRKAIRQFTRTRRFEPPTKREFTEYDPPPEKVE